MMNNWQKGTLLNNGRYTIEKILGEGGFGITYLAWDNHSIGTKIVIKTLKYRVQKRPDFEEFQKRFRDEAEKLNKCRHKNIVKFDNSFQEDQLYCIVMEYIDGENLGLVISEQGILPEHKAINYIRQIADALIVVHRKNILHRDIKPENIILRRNTEEVILIDFGIAREFIPNQINSFTQFYTPGYAPIEQQVTKHKYKQGKSTDVYALAATFYVLLTNTQYNPSVEPKQINKKISDRVNHAIIKGMEIQPEERPQNVQEWLTLLQVQPQNITSQMPQVFGKIYTQMSTYIPGVKRNIYQNSLKSSYIGKANGLFIVAGILIFFLVVVYIFFPNLNFSRNSRPSIDKKIDYTALENLLSSYQFKEADEETLRILLSLVGREKQYWFDLEDIKNIPCKDLHKINQLWVNYSNGKFGFSIQKQIWIELGGKIGIFDVAIADIFIKQVGWGEKYKRYKNITYKISASYGHIPFRATTHVRNFGVPYIAKKLAKCNL